MVIASADASRLELALNHLVQNAIEASNNAEPVTIAVDGNARWRDDRGDRPGMRDVTGLRARGTVPPVRVVETSGFGIGAFEARQLIESFGGRLEVESREGCGTTLPYPPVPRARPAAGSGGMTEPSAHC